MNPTGGFTRRFEDNPIKFKVNISANFSISFYFWVFAEFQTKATFCNIKLPHRSSVHVVASNLQ